MRPILRASLRPIFLVSMAWFASPAIGAIAVVQSTGLFVNGSGATTTSPAFATAPKVGNRIVVMAWVYGGGNLTVSVADSNGNTYSSDAQVGDGFAEAAAVLSAPVTVTSATLKITVSGSGAAQISAVAVEYSGIGSRDQSATATRLNTTATVATSVATTSANELVVAALGVDQPYISNLGSITPTVGYTTRGVELDNLNYTAGSGVDQIASSTGIQAVTWTGGSAFVQWAAVMVTYSPSATAPPDHYAVSTTGSAVNCQPAPVTISAHTSAHALLATTDTIAISTSTGHGDWTLTAGGGTFSAGGANSGTATYKYTLADNGTVVLALRDTYPEAVIINVADGSVTAKSGSALASEDAPLTFAPSGFRFTNGSNVATTIATQIAGLASTQSLALQAIRTDTNTGACTSVFGSGQTANISLGYQCNNPVSCVAGQVFSISNNGTATSIAANPASGVSSYTTVPLKFSTANAEAPISVTYSDVGQITLWAKYNIPLGNGAASANAMTGGGQFVVQPYTLNLSNIKTTGSGTANPAASTATGPVFIGAGQSFTATVTASNYQGAATPNFGQETSPATVTLTSTLVLPASGHNPTLAGSFGAYTGGSATGTAFSWPEVGIITLTPGIANYLNSGAVTGTLTSNVGRFVPNSFAIAVNTPVFGTACSAGSFTYVGQPFTYTVAPVITATAQAVGGATTQNYTGSLMRISNTSLTGRTYTPTPASPALNLTGLPATSIDPAIADLKMGQVTLTFSAGTGISFTRGSAVAPFNANIALAENLIDLDGVSAVNPISFGLGLGLAFSTSAQQWYGRLALRDSVGSEQLDLPLPLTTQYYASTTQGFVTNTSDVCTTAPSIAFSNYQQNLTSGKTCVRDSGNPGASGVGCSVAASNGYNATASLGNFNLILAAPGSGNNGALTVTAIAPAWLQYLWSVSAASNSSPSSMATFGLFPGETSRVHQREVY